MTQPKIAIVCDWLTNMGGAEHLLYSLHKAFPDAPIYTSVFEPDKCPLFKGLDIRTTYLQHLPRFLRRRHQLLPLLRTHAFRCLNLNEYDIIISSASAEAKAVRASSNAMHICYCHTPTRYYWSHYDEYTKEPGFGAFNPVVRIMLPVFVRWMRRLDLRAARGVDHFIANSHEVQRRIQQYYKRESTVIFPPVDIARFKPTTAVVKEDFYLIAGRQIPYKRFDVAIAACNQLRRRLMVIGNGSEHDKLVSLAGPTIEFHTNVDDAQIAGYFQRAKAFLFPALEDFGITPVEAMAAGTPVIAYQGGGALDSVQPDVSGIFFTEQTAASLVEAIQSCESKSWDTQAIIAHAQQFDAVNFIQAMNDFVQRYSKTPTPEYK